MILKTYVTNINLESFERTEEFNVGDRMYTILPSGS
jgi:hypothetical protein